jgi:hypothetical protein
MRPDGHHEGSRIACAHCLVTAPSARTNPPCSTIRVTRTAGAGIKAQRSGAIPLKKPFALRIHWFQIKTGAVGVRGGDRALHMVSVSPLHVGLITREHALKGGILRCSPVVAGHWVVRVARGVGLDKVAFRFELLLMFQHPHTLEARPQVSPGALEAFLDSAMYIGGGGEWGASCSSR